MDSMVVGPEVKVAFWAITLVLLVVILYMLRRKTEKMDERKWIQQGVYSAGAGKRMDQENSVPYLPSDLQTLSQLKWAEVQKHVDQVNAEATEAARDQMALASMPVDGEATKGVAGTKAREYMTSERGEASVSGLTAKYIIPTEKMTATRQGIQQWMVGGDFETEEQHEEASRNPELSPNRWTLQLQNQINTVNTDSIEGRLDEDVLFQRHLANM